MGITHSERRYGVDCGYQVNGSTQSPSTTEVMLRNHFWTTLIYPSRPRAADCFRPFHSPLTANETGATCFSSLNLTTAHWHPLLDRTLGYPLLFSCCSPPLPSGSRPANRPSESAPDDNGQVWFRMEMIESCIEETVWSYDLSGWGGEGSIERVFSLDRSNNHSCLYNQTTLWRYSLCEGGQCICLISALKLISDNVSIGVQIVMDNQADQGKRQVRGG